MQAEAGAAPASSLGEARPGGEALRPSRLAPPSAGKTSRRSGWEYHTPSKRKEARAALGEVESDQAPLLRAYSSPARLNQTDGLDDSLSRLC